MIVKSPFNLPKKEYLILIYIFAISFAFYLYIQTRHPLIYGYDGPYYLSQVRSLLERGRLEYPSLTPLSFYVFAFFSILFNRDVTFGIRFTLALFSSLATIPFYFWVKKATGSELSGYITMLACTFSAPHLRLFLDLYKNVMGIFFLSCFVTSLHYLVVGGENRRMMLFAFASLILTAVTHSITFYVALLFLVVCPSLALFLGVNKKTVLIKNVGSLLLSVLLLSIIGFLANPSFFVFYVINLPTQLSGYMFVDALMVNLWQFFLHTSNWGFFIIPVILTGLVLTIDESRRVEKDRALSIGTVTSIGLLLLLPVFFIAHEMLKRFLFFEFIPMAFIVGYSASKMRSEIARSIMLFLFLTPLIIQAITYSRTLGPLISMKEYREIELIGGSVQPNSIVVTNFRNPYWVQYITRSDTRKSLSPRLWLDYDHVFLLSDKSSPENSLPISNATRVMEQGSFTLYELNPPLSQ
jgi:hypothetical protein